MFFRNIILNEGLFNQVRVDHGKEFVLTLYMQEILAHHRTNPNRDPHRQTESKKVMAFFCACGIIELLIYFSKNNNVLSFSPVKLFLE